MELDGKIVKIRHERVMKINHLGWSLAWSRASAQSVMLIVEALDALAP
jgi:hypothetical protein